MEGTLKGPHPMFEKHDEEFLLNDRGCIMEREQIGEGVSIVLGFGKESVFVKPGNRENRFGHQTVCRFDHLVAFL